MLTRPVTKSNDAIVYDPRKGFRINLRKVENPEGRYICTAHYNNDVRDLEYDITSKSEPESAPPDNYEGTYEAVNSVRKRFQIFFLRIQATSRRDLQRRRL